jgi:hypothetical protein
MFSKRIRDNVLIVRTQLAALALHLIKHTHAHTHTHTHTYALRTVAGVCCKFTSSYLAGYWHTVT